jgi:hypothetical protein
MGDTILGIPVPGAPPGNPDELRGGRPVWHRLGDEIDAALNDFVGAAAQLDWQSAAATAFRDSLDRLGSESRGDIRNYGAFGDKLKEAGDRIAQAQDVYNVSLAAATAAAGIGLAATVFTLGASDAAAAAEVAADIGAITTEEGLLQSFMAAVRAGIEAIISNFIRNFVTQMIVNVVAQEATSVLTGHGLVAPNLVDAAVYSAAFSLVPGGGLARTVIGSLGADAVAQELTTGSVNPGELLLTGLTAGGFHLGGQAIRGFRGGTGETLPAEEPGGQLLLDGFEPRGVTPGAEAPSPGSGTDLGGPLDEPLPFPGGLGGRVVLRDPIPEPAAPLDPAAQAQALIDRGVANAPRIRDDLQEITASGNLSIPEGSLEHELKTPGSLERKIADEAVIEGVSPGEMAARIKDTVRYTLVADASTLSADVRSTIGDLRDRGYQVLEVKNSFQDGATYKGINATLRSPDGQVFELQFHTPESLEVKGQTHGLFEELRLPDTSDARKAEIIDELRQMSAQLDNPPGVGTLGTPKAA